MNEEMVMSVGEGVECWELWWYLAGPMLLALALGVLGVWAWTVRKRRPRVSRAVRWGLAVYLLAGALGWGLLVSSAGGPPEWFGWGAGETEASP